MQKRSGDLIFKEDKRVATETITSSPSHWTSSEAAGYRDGIPEAGACAELMGVGTWLR